MARSTGMCKLELTASPSFARGDPGTIARAATNIDHAQQRLVYTK